jgi:hypothetical protein
MMTQVIQSLPINVGRIGGSHMLMVPKGSEIASCYVHDNQLRVVVLAPERAVRTPNSETVQVRVIVAGTGDSVDMDTVRYLGTAQTGPYVWHVFVGETVAA